MFKNNTVVNYVTERRVKLIEDFNNETTKNESPKQYLLQIVSDYCKKQPNHKKYIIFSIYILKIC